MTEEEREKEIEEFILKLPSVLDRWIVAQEKTASALETIAKVMSYGKE